MNELISLVCKFGTMYVKFGDSNILVKASCFYLQGDNYIANIQGKGLSRHHFSVPKGIWEDVILPIINPENPLAVITICDAEK